MANSSVTMPDSTGTPRTFDTQTTPDGNHQQTITIGDGVTDGRVVAVEDGGYLRVQTNTCSTATKTNVTSSTVDTQILAANSLRRGFMIYNQGTASMNLSFGTVAASTTSFSVLVPANSTYTGDIPVFTGMIRAVWSATGNTARVTEFTA